MKEFFGIGGHTRPVEGFLSWQHLLFSTVLVGIMIALAVFFGLRSKDKSPAQKNKVLIAAAISIDAFELLKILVVCYRSGSAEPILYNLPLFLCSIQLITIPLAAFSRGRVKEAAIDFICIFGVLGALLGTYAAGNIYGSNPVLSFDPIVSGITHTISGFTALYCMISGMAGLKKENILITVTVLTLFCIAAYITNHLIDYNYMFLMQGDGTPYDILYNLVGGSKILYPLGVMVLFYVYISLFYGVCFLLHRKKKAPATV